MNKEVSIKIKGMTCSGCASRIARDLNTHDGVLETNVNFALENAVVIFDNTKINAAKLKKSIIRSGFQVDDAHNKKNNLKELKKARNDLIIALVFTLPLLVNMVTKMLFDISFISNVAAFLLSFPVQFWVGRRFYSGAYKSIRSGVGNMDVLVALGTSAAWFFSAFILFFSADLLISKHLYFDSAASVISFILLGKLLEYRAKQGTTDAIKSLLSLKPQKALVIRDGVEVEVAIEDVVLGDVIIIKTGSNIPVDATVISGSSYVDESFLTGESMAVAKNKDDKVICGSINQTGFLKIKATAIGKNTTLAKIIKLVESAQVGKAPIQKLVDKVSAIFVPIVVSISVLTLLTWLLSGASVSFAISAMVSVLVIACPCALGLATPTAIVTGIGVAAKHGILIKDIQTLEVAHLAKTVVFDKTGTLTKGVLEFVQIDLLSAKDENEVMRLALSVESGSDHPLANALSRHAHFLKLQAYDDVTEFQSITGAGVSAIVSGQKIFIGTSEFMQKKVKKYAGKMQQTTMQVTKNQNELGCVTVIVADSDNVLAVISFADELRASSIKAIQLLKGRDITTVLMSGDSKVIVDQVASKLQIDKSYAQMLPEQKLQQVELMQEKGVKVVMVGDGINDTPALATADVSIAMSSGSDIAMQSSDVTLMRPDPVLVVDAISISSATWSKIKQNLFWAFIYNIIGIPIAAFGLLNPALAGFAMALSSVSVVTSSLWLKRWKSQL